MKCSRSNRSIPRIPRPSKSRAHAWCGCRRRRRRVSEWISPRSRQPSRRGRERIFFATPNNPSGAVMSAAELAAIGRLAERHALWVVADEVYAGLAPGGRVPSLAAGLPDRVVTIGSLSKTHAMPGWRAGWMVGPKTLIAHTEALAMCMLYGLPGFIQEAALTAVGVAAEAESRTREFCANRLGLVLAGLDGAPGLRCHVPDAGMFMLIDVRGCGLSGYEFMCELYRSRTGVGARRRRLRRRDARASCGCALRPTRRRCAKPANASVGSRSGEAAARGDSRVADMGIIARTPGGPEVLEWVPLDTAAPGPDEVRVRQHAIGVNFIDIYFRTGVYPWPSTPLDSGRRGGGRRRGARPRGHRLLGGRSGGVYTADGRLSHPSSGARRPAREVAGLGRLRDRCVHRCSRA